MLAKIKSNYHDAIRLLRCEVSNVFVYSGEMFVFFTLQVLTWTIFIVITIKLLQKSHKAITTENLATTKELKKDFLILATLFVLLGMSLVFTAALILASGVFQDRSASTSPLFNIGLVITLLQGPALFLLQGVRLREVRQLWYQWLCCQCRRHLLPHHILGTSRINQRTII